MAQLNKIPDFVTKLIENGITNKDWYFFFVGTFTGIPPSNVAPINPSTSPFHFIAPSKGSVIVQGGTISALEFSRDNMDYYNIGVNAGMVTLNKGDILRTTYTVAPTMTFIPT